MPEVAKITLESDNGDSVVVSDPDGEFLTDDIILDTNPDGIYDTGFTVRTMSGAFERGGRVVGETVPIRELVLPFHLTVASRPRFQRLWGTPGNFRKVRWHYDGPSGRRSLTLRLSKQIQYTTEDGFDGAIDDQYHAVVSAIAVNPMYEGKEDVASWTNPGNRFVISMRNIAGGNFTLTWTPTGGSGQTTANIAINSPALSAARVRTALEALPGIGAGKVTVTGTPTVGGGETEADFTVELSGGLAGVMSGSGADLSGSGPFSSGKVFGVVGACIGWFELWNPTDQDLWPEWEFDPAQWQFPDFGFGRERKWGRAVGEDAARLIVTPVLTKLLSVMSDPMMDTYVSADLSNAAGLFNGVEPRYPVPPYTGVSSDRVKTVGGAVHIVREVEPVMVPVICNGPPGVKVTLRQRRFWSAESGLEA